MLVKGGRYQEVYIPDDIYQELREAVAERVRLQEPERFARHGIQK
jgi:transposase